MGMMSIVSRGDLLRKLNFSKSIIVFSAIAGAAINYAINLLVVFVFALLNGVSIGLGWFVIIPLFIELILLSTGISFILASSFVKYRDIGPIWEVALQAGLYATPIIYSLTFIIQRGQVSIAKIMMLNPIAQIVQDLRYYIIYSGSTRGWDLIQNHWLAMVPYLLPILIFIIGYLVFNKQSKRFAEIL